MIAFPPKRSFRDWLRSFPPDAVIAKQWSCCKCPLARWMSDDLALPGPYVSPGETAAESCWRINYGEPNSERGLLTNWANIFALKVDKLAKSKSKYFFGPVTASECLAILAKCPR